MDFLTGNLKSIYFKYLRAAFGGALITSIYGLVDMAMVGNYQGPEGTAALAVVMPVWNIIYSLGLLVGTGGSVYFSTLLGESQKNRRRANEYFTVAAAGAAALAALVWLGLLFFDRELLTLFGARDSLLPLALRYVRPVKVVVPVFLFNQALSAFLRNDGDPGLATRAVLIGGVFNVFGDYFFVFTMDWGMFGAGFATAAGSVLSLLVMLTHFLGKKNTLRLVKPEKPLRKLREICVTGFSTFFIDVAMGILTVFFNRQVLHYLGPNALSVYAVIASVSNFAQCCAYSVGQAAQPILSTNFGAGQGERIRQVLKYALGSAGFFALLWTALSMAAPNLFIRLFMTPTEAILAMAPAIIRTYALSFLLLPLNVFSTYYFQALMRPGVSFVVSVARGAVVSGLFIFLLPVTAGPDAIWWAMPITELLTAVYVAFEMTRSTKALPTAKEQGGHSPAEE